MVRRGVAVGAGTLAVAGGLLMFDPAAPVALAYAAPPPPITIPGSVVAAESVGVSGSQAVASLAASDGLGVAVTANAAKVGMTGAEASAGTAAVGLMVGTYGGVQIAKAVGLPTSGDIVCDTLLLLDPNSTCHAGAQDGYVVNSDAIAGVLGWDGGVNSIDVDTRYGTSVGDNNYTTAQLVISGVDHVGDRTEFTLSIAMSDSAQFGYRYAVQCVDSVGYVYASQFSMGDPVSVRSYGFSGRQTMSCAFQALDWVSGAAEGPVITYRSAYDPAQFPGGDGNPERWWRTTWQCSDGSGSSVTSAGFYETDPEWPGIPSAVCEAGAPMHVLVEQITSGSPTTTITEWTAPGVVSDWASAHPECLDGSCSLVLYRLDGTTGQRLSCFSNPYACIDWWSSPTKVDEYVCTYGGSTVALAECDVYRPTFNRSAGQPTTNNAGQPVPASQTQPYGDPSAQGDPVTTPDASTDPGQEPDDGCPPPFTFTAGGIGYWVTKGAECALEWAFVPVETPSKVDGIVTTLGTKSPFVEIGSIQTALNPPDSSTLCMQLSLPIAFVIGHDQPLLDSCTWSDPVSQLLHQYRTLLGAAVWVTVVAPLAWWAWRQYAPAATGAA